MPRPSIYLATLCPSCQREEARADPRKEEEGIIDGSDGLTDQEESLEGVTNQEESCTSFTGGP
jgi:hypothetical protein